MYHQICRGRNVSMVTIYRCLEGEGGKRCLWTTCSFQNIYLIFCFIETLNRSKVVSRGGNNSCCSDSFSFSILINHAVVLLRNINIDINFCSAYTLSVMSVFHFAGSLFVEIQEPFHLEGNIRNSKRMYAFFLKATSGFFCLRQRN